MGGGGSVVGGKVKGQLSLRPVTTLVVRERMKKAPAVQSGRALPMGRCASPPCTQPDHPTQHTSSCSTWPCPCADCYP